MSKSKRDPKSIGATIRRLRQDRDWTQEELAERSGISRPTIGLYESGASKSQPNTRTLQALAAALGVKWSDLAEARIQPAGADFVDRFLSDERGKAARPNEEEISWLRSSDSLWVGLDPTPEAVYLMLLARRLSKH